MNAFRAVAGASCVLVGALYPALPRAQAPPGCAAGGIISATSSSTSSSTSGRMPLPGVVVSLTDPDGRVVDLSSSAADGAYTVRIPAPGEYTLKAELVAFASVARPLSVDVSNCQQRVDLNMTLASRAPAIPSGTSSTSSSSQEAGQRGGITGSDPRASSQGSDQGRSGQDASRRGGQGSVQGGGRGQGGRQGGPRSQGAQRGQRAQGGIQGGQASPTQFQNLELVADAAGLARVDDSADAESAARVLPPGFSPETSAESVTTIATAQPATFFGPGGPGDFAQRFGNGFGEGGEPGAFNGPGGRGGPGEAFGGAFGGRGGPFGGGGGPFGGRGGRNQIRGSLYQSFSSSALDSAPFALNGQATAKPDYFQQRFGATLGGPLTIPHIVDNPRTFFFLNYTGNHSRNPYDSYSTVPTLAERAGDLSAFSRPIIDPSTGQPFDHNQIPVSKLDPAARSLLGLIPLPNQSGDLKNSHTVTTSRTAMDDVNVRFVHAFGATPERGRGNGRGGGFGGGGGRGGRAGASNLNLSIHYRHADSTSTNPFPTLGGSTKTNAWDVPVGYSFSKAGMQHSLRGQFNRQHAEGQNLFAFNQNVAGEAGLVGASVDPFDWGAPNLSFSSFTSVRDMSPSTRTDRTLAVGETSTKIHGKHTVRLGGDYRDIHADSRTDANARGSYVFTGLYSGLDFGDFLLGLPQQATVQFGPGLEQFRSRSWDLFAQDDWRTTDSLTINAGLRYEYFSPVAESGGRLVSLDVAPGFAAASQVVAGQSGPYSGLFADTIVHPFRGGVAPRIGVAWRPRQGTVLRGGYGINYSTGVYQSIAQQLAAQPPFAVTDTVLATRSSPILIESALADVAPGVTMNSYAVDPNYRPGQVQMFNVDVQRDLSRTLQLSGGYSGTRGSHLDMLRAPNRGPTGLRIAGVAPFIWQSSEGSSRMNSLTVRLRKRMTSGIAASGAYTLSKSTDNASSLGGAGNGIVAQNDQDLGAEWGLSSFDQRHRFSGDFAFELPFGSNKRWFTEGAPAALLGNWVINGSVQIASGTPFTARVLSSAGEVARGTNGTLRANYNGQSIDVTNPTVAQFFNTAAFSIPQFGTFGTAGRNTIIGPGTSVLNFSLTRNLNLGETSGLSIQVLANNVLNTVQFASIDTVINSPTFGQVTSVRPMRRIQVLTRLRF